MALVGCGPNGRSDDSGAYEKTNYLTDEAANQRAVDALEPYSLAQLQRRTQEISADESSWAKKGLTITAVGPDIPRNRVVVSFSTADIPATARSTFLQTYGPETTIGPPGVAAGADGCAPSRHRGSDAAARGAYLPRTRR